MIPENQDGFVEGIYQYLWLSDPLEHSVASVLIPDTIIYKNNNPTAWYFTLDGMVKLKGHQHLHADSIYDSFIKKHNAQHEAVALFIERTKINNQQRIVYHFFNREKFKSFMFDVYWMKEGVLQRFILGKGDYHNVIKCQWSYNFCSYEVITNRWAKNAEVDIYQKTATYEDANAPVSTLPLVSKSLTQRIETHLYSVVKHLKNVSIERLDIMRMTVIMTQTSNDQLYLVAFTNIRLNNKQPHSDKLAMKPIYQNTHVQVPSYIEGSKLRDMNATSITKDVVCLGCDNLCNRVDMHILTLKDVVRSSQKTQQQPSTSIRLHARRLTARKTQQSFNTQVQRSKLVDIPYNQGVPAMISKLFPALKTNKYDQLRNNPGFQNLSVSLCLECFVKMHDRVHNNYTIEGISQKHAVDTKVFTGIQEKQPEKIFKRKNNVKTEPSAEIIPQISPQNQKKREILNLVGFRDKITSLTNLSFSKLSTSTTRVFQSPTHSSAQRNLQDHYFSTKSRSHYKKHDTSSVQNTYKDYYDC